MASHNGRAFINSCLKVPIDPCNNCPAPNYNRPKMYLGRNFAGTATTSLSNSTKVTTTIRAPQTTTTPTTMKTDLLGTSTTEGIRSLCKLYESIPDYSDINHLTEEEFYSTLDSLRTTCRKLKTNSPNRIEYCMNSSTPSSLLSSQFTLGFSGKSKKSSSNKKKGNSKKKSNGNKKNPENYSQTPASSLTATKLVICEPAPTRLSKKQEIEDEIKIFNETIKKYEKQFKRHKITEITTPIVRAKSVCSATKEKIPPPSTKHGQSSDLIAEAQVPVVGCSPAARLREHIRKAFSFNDIHDINCHDERINILDNDNKKHRWSKGKDFIYCREPGKLSKYFREKTKNDLNEPHLRKSTPVSVSSGTFSSASTAHAKRKKKTKTKRESNEQMKTTCTLFDLDEPKKENIGISASPMHPVARPNLAATLRASVSRKKLQELKGNNDCTYRDTTPHFDWEVRKTPAWRSLALNEKHEQILQMRLATRKAEQAIQQREFDMNMKMMRHRVKSAPLLLEGATYWGPQVGKLTHTCQKDTHKHDCPSKSCSRGRKKRPSSMHCRAGGNGDINGVGGIGSDCGFGSRMSNKANVLRKVYANISQCSSSRKARARSRQETPEVQRVSNNESGDDLSSLDRAYL